MERAGMKQNWREVLKKWAAVTSVVLVAVTLFALFFVLYENMGNRWYVRQETSRVETSVLSPENVLSEKGQAAGKHGGNTQTFPVPIPQRLLAHHAAETEGILPAGRWQNIEQLTRKRVYSSEQLMQMNLAGVVNDRIRLVNMRMDRQGTISYQQKITEAACLLI